MSEHEHENGHEHEDDYVPGDGNEVEEALEEALELDTQSQIFLEMRRQNVDLLKIAAEVAGYSQGHPPLRPGDLRGAMDQIWKIYSSFYEWIDPEESDDDDDEEEDDDL